MSMRVAAIIPAGVMSGSDNAAEIHIICDTQADLPSGLYFVSGWKAQLGSKAHVVSDSTDWEMQSDGTWIQSASPGLGNYYTKTETDALLQPISDAADAAQASADTNKSYIGILSAQAGKNRLTADQTTQTIDTATITANGDGTYHVETTSPTTQQVVFTLGTALLHTGIEYIISGISGGSNTTFFLNYDHSSAAGTGNQNIYAGGYQITTGEVERLTTVKFYIRSGQSINVDISPMISEKQWYTAFPDFVPYQITLQDLYELVRSYHP